jgi:hypothetical protein
MLARFNKHFLDKLIPVNWKVACINFDNLKGKQALVTFKRLCHLHRCTPFHNPLANLRDPLKTGTTRQPRDKLYNRCTTIHRCLSFIFLLPWLINQH